MKTEINIKHIIYRSSTLFIAAMRRLFKIQSSSCFEVIEKLADMNELTAFAKHKQMYAVALACEIRLRWYMQCKSQNDSIVANTRDKNAVEKLFSIVGKRSTANYFQIAYALQCDISKRLNLKKIHFFSNPQLLNFSIEICLGLNHSKLPISRPQIEETKFIRLFDFDKCLQLLENMNFRFFITEENDKTNTSNASDLLQYVGNILYESNCYDDALAYYQKTLQILTTDKDISVNILNYNSFEIYTLWKNRNDLAQTLSIVLNQIGMCLTESNKANVAIEYLQKTLTIQRMSINKATNLKLASIFYSIGLCCFSLHELKTAKKYLQKALQIKERATTNAETDTSLATTLHSLGGCLLNMNQHTEALEYFQRALQIDERATTNAETDTSLATTLHELGRCLLDMNQHSEALEYFQRALQIKERATTNAETDTSLATTLHSHGRCLLDMNQHTEAHEYFQRALQIYERATTNAETIINFALCVIFLPLLF